MTPDELRASVSKSPFRPFRVVLTNGGVIVCENPERWCISRSGSNMYVGGCQFTADQVERIEPHDEARYSDLEVDLMIAREAIARIRAGEPTIPWEEVKAKLGLDGNKPKESTP